MSTEQNTRPGVAAWVEFAGEYFTVVGNTRYKLELSATLRDWQLYALENNAWKPLLVEFAEIDDAEADPVSFAKAAAFARIPENLHPWIVEALASEHGCIDLQTTQISESELEDFAWMWAERDKSGVYYWSNWRILSGIIPETKEEWAVCITEVTNDD